MSNNSVAINSVRSQSFSHETALTKVSCHLLQRIPDSRKDRTDYIYGSVCVFLLYFRNFSRDPSGSQCRFTEVFAHSCFTPKFRLDPFWKSRPVYGSVCKNAGYFGNSEQPAFKATHYLKINIISPAKTAAIIGFPTMTVNHLIIRVFFGI